MKVLNASQTVEVVPVDSIQTHPQNPRKSNVKSLAKLIKNNGFYGALIVQKSTGYILKGNHTYLAMRDELGATEVSVIFIDVDDAAAKRILTADNRASDLGSYDDRVLADLLEDILHEDGNLTSTGYARVDLDKLIQTIEIDKETDFLDDIIDENASKTDPAVASTTTNSEPSHQHGSTSEATLPGSNDQSGPHPEPRTTVEEAEEDDQHGGGAAAETSAPPPRMYQLSYSVTIEQREAILKAIAAAKNDLSTSNSMEALTHVCNSYAGGDS